MTQIKKFRKIRDQINRLDALIANLEFRSGLFFSDDQKRVDKHINYYVKARTQKNKLFRKMEDLINV
jgi:hypothetical protein